MKRIYRKYEGLYGCDIVDKIFADAYQMKEAGQKIESYIYLVGCYAANTGDRVLRNIWLHLRKLYNLGFYGAGLYNFRQSYRGACLRINYILGWYAYCHTLTFEL